MAVKVLTVVLKYSCIIIHHLSNELSRVLYFDLEKPVCCHILTSFQFAWSLKVYTLRWPAHPLWKRKNFSDCKTEHPFVIFASFLLGNHALRSKNSDACQQL